MDFVEKIRKNLGVTRYAMAYLLDVSHQTYRSLTMSSDRIRIRELVNLRKLADEAGWDDTKLLDEIEREYKKVSRNAKK